jgi:hypothetical protein
MQKIASIFFISLLVFFQYGKALSYLHCLIENAIRTGAVYCDCQKQIKDNAANTSTSAPQKTTFKEKLPDNLFTYRKQTISQNDEPESVLICTSNNSLVLSIGFYASIFQPPRA